MFEIDPNWPHRLVRAEIDLDAARINFYAQRQRAPAEQPLLATRRCTFPIRKFHG